MKISTVYLDGTGNQTVRFDLACGHVVRGVLPHLEPGDDYACPVCDPKHERLQPATLDELEQAVSEYRSIMEKNGIEFPPDADAALLRSARIQDVWRVAFKRVFG